MKTDLYDKKGEKVGTVDLPERVFGVRWNSQLVHQALVAQTKNARQTLAHAKGRHEVSGGGKKPWAQKHTGRARHSSIRSPIWKGGGVAHGPVKERVFSVKINKTMRQLAIFSLLSRKFKDGEIKVVDSLLLESPKTKLVASMLSNLLSLSKKSSTSALIIPNLGNNSIFKASRNIEKVKGLGPNSLNVYDLLRYKYIILEKGAIDAIDKGYKAK